VVSGVTMVMNPPPDANQPPLTPTPEILALTPEPVSVKPPPPPPRRPPPVPASSLRSAPTSQLPPPRSSQGGVLSPRPSPPPLPRKKG
jgi:hypothetical protein